MKNVALSVAATRAANGIKDVRDILLVVQMALGYEAAGLDEDERSAIDHVVGLALQAARSAIEAAETADAGAMALTR